MIERYDPRDSWLVAAGLFVAGLALAADLSRPGGGVLGGGLWIPVAYAVVPVAVGLLAYVRTRGRDGRSRRSSWSAWRRGGCSGRSRPWSSS